MYKYYNRNAHGMFVNDCVVRAISTATNEPWNDTYKKLSDLARMNGVMMDNVDFVEDYLNKRFERVCDYDNTVGEFIKKHPKGTFIISMPGHLTCAIDGVNYDTFDTTGRRMWCSWKVK